MNAIKTVTRYQGLDGKDHLSERDAVIASISHLIGCSAASVIEGIEPRLPTLMPLLQKLCDPRNAAPKAPPSRAERTGRYTDIAASRPDYIAGQLDTRTLIDVEPATQESISHPGWGAGADLDIDDLRAGQTVELIVEDAEGVTMEIDRISCDNLPEPLVIGRIFGPEGDPVGSPHTSVHLEDIKRVLVQPEEKLGLEEARTLLETIEKNDVLTSLQMKQRILLNRRIELLEESAGESDENVSRD